MNTLASLPGQAPKRNTWVQTDRATHEQWALLTAKSPKAGALLHFLTARVGDTNAVVASQKDMADWLGVSVDTIKRAINQLKMGNWIETVRISNSSVYAYVLNERVAWWQKRDQKSYALFYAAVMASAADQENADRLGTLSRLRQLPRVWAGETQMPSGSGMDPPSQPALPDMEQDLPAMQDNQDEQIGMVLSPKTLFGTHPE